MPGGKSYRTAASVKIIPRMSPGELVSLREGPGLTLSSTPFGSPPDMEAETGYYFKKAVDWKRNVAVLPAGSRTGLGKAVALSKATTGVLGTTVGREGTVVTRKGERQFTRHGEVGPLSPEERRSRARAYREPGVTPIGEITTPPSLPGE